MSEGIAVWARRTIPIRQGRNAQRSTPPLPRSPMTASFRQSPSRSPRRLCKAAGKRCSSPRPMDQMSRHADGVEWYQRCSCPNVGRRCRAPATLTRACAGDHPRTTAERSAVLCPRGRPLLHWLPRRPRFRPLEPWQRNQYAVVLSVALAFCAFELTQPFMPLYIRELGAEDLADAAFWSGLVVRRRPARRRHHGAVLGRAGRQVRPQAAGAPGADHHRHPPVPHRVRAERPVAVRQPRPDGPVGRVHPDGDGAGDRRQPAREDGPGDRSDPGRPDRAGRRSAR